MENFWTGACAPKEEGSSWAQGSSLSGRPKAELQSLRKLGKTGQKTEKVALFSILTAHGLWPLPDVDSGNREWGGIQTSLVHAALMALRVSSCSPVMQHTNLTSAHNPCGTEGGPRYPRVAWHTNPASSHKTYGANSGPGC